MEVLGARGHFLSAHQSRLPRKHLSHLRIAKTQIEFGIQSTFDLSVYH